MLNISKQITAAWDSSSTRFALPEAEIVPLGDTSNEKKRLEKVTNKYTNSQEYDNSPLPGYTLYKTNRKNWGSADQTWLVIDPRGFLGRITSENLESILDVTGITEGLIQEKCVWAREDAQTKMTLVPVSSPSYIEAVKNTELIEGKVSVKDIQIGDKVLLQNKLEGTYMGTLSLYGPLQEVRTKATDKPYKPHAALRRQVVEIEPGKFYYNTDCKMLTITEEAKVKLTKQETSDYINGHVAAGTAMFSKVDRFHARYSTYGAINFVSPHAVPKPLITLEEIDINAATILFRSAFADLDPWQLLLENSKGRFIIDFPYNSQASTTSFNVTKVHDKFEGDVEEIVLAGKRNSWYYANTTGTESLDKYTKFYKIVKHVKDETYI